MALYATKETFVFFVMVNKSITITSFNTVPQPRSILFKNFTTNYSCHVFRPSSVIPPHDRHFLGKLSFYSKWPQQKLVSGAIKAN